MKTSSQVLLLLIFTTVAFTISVPAIFRHQLSASRYTNLHSNENFEFDRKIFENARIVHLKGINNATVVPFDALRVDVEKAGSQGIVTKVKGDTLEISAIENTTDQRVRIFLPEGTQLSCSQASILVRGALDGLDSLRMHITLSRSRMKIEPVFKDEKVPQYWDQLILSATDSATVSVSGVAIVNRLEITNVSELKLGDRIFVDDMVISYSDKKLVHSVSDDRGLVVTGF